MKFMGYPERELKQLVRETKALEAQEQADTIIDAGAASMMAYLVDKKILKDPSLPK